MRYAAVALLATALTSSVVRAQSSSQGSPRPPSQTASQAPEVLVQQQPDAPLRLSVKTKWVSDGRGFEIATAVENVSDRAVRAYTTRHTPESGPRGGCSLWNIMSPGKVLRPGQTDVKSTWRGYSPSDPVLTYAVDFIELADGTTWGSDLCQSAERLAGERAGGGAAARRLLDLLASGGPDAVMKAVREGAYDVSTPPGHSPVWEEGFLVGTKVIGERVLRAVEEHGPDEIEHTLRRPYDAAGTS
jgi:hypothetical protein